MDGIQMETQISEDGGDRKGVVAVSLSLSVLGTELELEEELMISVMSEEVGGRQS